VLRKRTRRGWGWVCVRYTKKWERAQRHAKIWRKAGLVRRIEKEGVAVTQSGMSTIKGAVRNVPDIRGGKKWSTDAVFQEGG